MPTRSRLSVRAVIAFALGSLPCHVARAEPIPQGLLLAMTSQSMTQGSASVLTAHQLDAKQQLRDAINAAITADVNDHEAVTSASKSIHRGVRCIWTRFTPRNAPEVVREVRVETLDSTSKRFAYDAYANAISGTVIRRDLAPCDRLPSPQSPKDAAK
jgi:hypothetical protein